MPTQASASPPQRQLLGPVRATVFIVSSMLGAGIFLLPSSLSKFGTIGILALVVSGFGALALGVSFGALASKLGSAAGPYGFAKDAFGRRVGFWTAWMFWLSAWAGTSAIVTVWVSYVGFLLPREMSAAERLAIAAIGLFAPVLINVAGPRAMSRAQSAALLISCIPIVILVTAGPFSITRDFLGPFNTSGQPALLAVAAALPVTVFVFVGVEAVAVLAEEIENPRRNVMRATVVGVLVCLVVYVLTTAVVMGTVSAEDRKAGLCSFSLCMSYLFGTPLAGTLMAVAAVLAGFSGLVGWALLSGEAPKCAAQDRMFPAVFARVTRRGVPMTGILLSQAMAAAVVLPVLLGGSGGLKVLDIVLSVAGIAAGVVFIVTVIADIAETRKSGTGFSLPRRVGVVVALGFSLAVIVASSIEAVKHLQAVLVLLLWLAIGGVTLRMLKTDSREDALPESQPPR
ncbi:MAG TPA: amino acid permease [Mycobacterium sp.]|nr:amino acid permease [Mycobacterium sp.]HPZ94980.1 amino acid permease [Mycobacterium sp.]HQE16350.1 amino acid permease [Mycobacterium sp.]